MQSKLLVRSARVYSSSPLSIVARAYSTSLPSGVPLSDVPSDAVPSNAEPSIAAPGTPTTSPTSPNTPTVIPFPFPYHVGTDLCSIARIHKLLRSRPTQFINRVMTPREIAELPRVDAVPASEARDPAPADLSESLTGKRTFPQETLSILASPASIIPRALQAELDGETGTRISANQRGSPLWRAAGYLAGRFAAKEAAIKAHPHVPSLTLQSIRIARRRKELRNNSGPPIAYVTLPPTAEGDTPVEQEARLSISHDGQYATAICLGYEAS